MGKSLWIALAFALPLGATAITATPIEGTASLGGSDLSVDLVGDAVNIHFSGDSPGDGAGCHVNVPCLLRQSGAAGNPFDIVRINGTYKGRTIDTSLRAGGTFDFVSLWTFGSGTMTGFVTIPIDVSGHIFLQFATTPEGIDLQIAGHGTDQVFVNRLGGDLLGVDLGLANFSGTFVETPEPSTTLRFVIGVVGLLARMWRGCRKTA